jgi:hypothetical protein
MAQRISGYVRQANDSYETPAWVTDAIVPHISKLALHVWEPAAGSGQMADALRNAGFRVTATDIATGVDFLECNALPSDLIQLVCTNPPYSYAQEFIEHALALTKPVGSVVAMLLRCDFDHAKPDATYSVTARRSRVLTRRIVFFDRPGAAPSFNHAWFLWDWQHKAPPTIEYAPVPEGCVR